MWPRNIAIHIVVFKINRVTCDVSDTWWKKWQKNDSFLLNSVSGWENVYHWRTFDILWHFVGFKRRKPEERELLRPGDALYNNYHFIPNTRLTYQTYRVYNINYSFTLLIITFTFTCLRPCLIISDEKIDAFGDLAIILFSPFSLLPITTTNRVHLGGPKKLFFLFANSF